jgi:formylglycine-generating enzyme required for sulfatase activity
MDFTSSFAATSFRKVLKGFEIGGLPYADVQFHLKRLLAAGTSPDELQEVLRRCELITPLPDFAHADVMRVIEEAKERAAVLAAEQPPDIEIELGDTDVTVDLDAEMEAMRATLHSEQARAQEMGRALADRISSEQATRARAEEARREADQLRGELRSARHSISERDAVIIQMRRSLNESNAQLDAAQKSQAVSSASLESRQKSAAQIQGELDASRAAFERLQRELTEREAKAAAQLQEHEGAARRRIDTLERELGAARELAAPLRKERDSLRGELSQLQSKLRDDESLIAALQQSVRNGARRAAELQTAALSRAEAPITAVPSVAVAAESMRVGDPPTAAVKPASRGKPRTRSPLAAMAAAIVVLAVVVWAYSRHSNAPANLLAPAAALPAGAVLKDCPECPSLTVLPAGRFQQGSAATASGGSPFEMPLHAVTIAHPFAMSTNAVTVDEFRAFAAATGRSMQGCDVYDGEWHPRADASWENPGFPQTGSHPVTCASWNDANAYAAWLSAKSGHHYRLPSASEWEYAARSGAAAVLPWGEASGACAAANVADQSAAHRFPGWTVFSCDDGHVFTAPVGTFRPNTFGLNDMLGNVFQWTEDCWHPDYAGAPSDGSARTDGDCSQRELRGGSWFSTPAYVRANYRNHFAADYRTSSAGIRLVRDISS